MRISDVFTMGGGYGHSYSGSSSDCGSFERYEEHCYSYSNCHYGNKSPKGHRRGFLGIF